MKRKRLIIEQFHKELEQGYFIEAIDVLLKGLHSFENDTELIEELSQLRTDYSIMSALKQEHIAQIRIVKEKTSGNNYSTVTLFEAVWSELHEGPQIAWELLAEALMNDPENDELLETIETLNECIEDAPVFADEMETIAKAVSKGMFPREVFDYLLLALADPNYPEYFELAEKIANKD